MVKVPNITLNNNLTIPALGLGTAGDREAAVQAIKDAIDVGYRFFDGAHIYRNEPSVGKAIKEKLEEEVVNREDLFISSKLWSNSHRPDLVEPALRTTLKDLQLEYVDLYLIHWPFSFKQGDDPRPMDPKTKQFIPEDVDYVDTWKAMEEVQRKGLTKSIGVSNFNSQQIDRLLKVATIKPVVNQVECHAYLSQNKLRKFCLDRGIVLTSYSPLGSPARPWRKPDDPVVLNDNKIKEIGDKYGKSSAQVLIRYNLQLGNIVIPKSSNKERQKENFDVFGFELSPEDMRFLQSLDRNFRVCPVPEASNLPYYPFASDVKF